MRGIMVAGVVALGVGLWPAAAHADETVVVPGTSFPSSSTYLTYFGCTDLYQADTAGPQVRVHLDDTAPLGRRATSLTMPGTGTASGPVSLVDSVATATATVAVSAPAGSQGVGYVWYVSSELEPGQVWAGRADLTAAADGWQDVDATAATYAWTRYDAASGAVVGKPGPPATIADFAAAHGDGPGYVLSGFGCDAQPFAIDALRVGTPGSVTTYDLEGWPVTTTVTASSESVAAGGEVELSGRSVDHEGRPMGASLVLEARPEGTPDFQPVGPPATAGEDGTVVTTVTPEVTTDYRWAFAETGYADAHWSAEVRVAVEPQAGG